jgi:hypothetical protein
MLIRMEGNQTLLDPPPDLAGDRARAIEKKTHAFTFDKSYWSAGDRNEDRYCSQQTLFDDLGNELLDHSFAGFNACILACMCCPHPVLANNFTLSRWPNRYVRQQRIQRIPSYRVIFSKDPGNLIGMFTERKPVVADDSISNQYDGM